MTQDSPPSTIRIFVSSPGDLSEEREALRQVIAGLNVEFARSTGGRVEIRALLWEDSMPRLMGYSPQQVIDFYLGQSSQTDVFLAMFWSRMGSETVVHGERHASGTLYELRDAYRNWRRTERPMILLFRSRRALPPGADTSQLRAVNDLFESGLKRECPDFSGFVHEFRDTSDLAVQAEQSLRTILSRLLFPPQADARRTPAPDATDEFRRLLDGIGAFLDSYDESQVRGRDGIEGLPLLWQEVAADGRQSEAREGPLLAAFDQRGGRLALIGGPGQGKTFAMQRLMRDLSDRARRRGAGPLPIYFNLASWSATRGPADAAWKWTRLFRADAIAGPLDGWLIDELVRRYGMSRSAATRTILNRQIVICLDGLDELRDLESDDPQSTTDLRDHCVRCINELLADHSVAMVLCCRDQTYSAMPLKPALGNPLKVAPLTLDQAMKHIARFADLDGLRDAAPRSPTLPDRLRVPLFLEYMCVAYSGMSAEAILAAAARPAAEWEKHLLDHYVRARLAIAPGDAPHKTLIERCLGWLARRDEPDFLVEDIQPDALDVLPSPALSGRAARRLYALSSGFLLSSLLAAFVVVPASLSNLVEWSAVASLRQGIPSALQLATVSFLITAIATFPAFRTRRWWVFGLITGTVFALVRFFVLWWTPPQGLGGTLPGAVRGGLITWPCSLAVFCLFGFYTLGRIERHRTRYADKPGIDSYEIQPLESFDWHWIDPHDRWRGGWTGLVAGPAIGLTFFVTFGPARAVAFGLIVTAFVSLFAGLSGTGLRVSYQPNQGIIRSWRHAFLMGLVFAITGVVACAVAYGAAFGPTQAVVNGILGAGVAFVFIGFGGIPVVRHACLGQVLAMQGNTPSWFCQPPWKRMIALLDDLVRYKLLRRSAGGYAFRHETLRAHFARPEALP